MPRKSPAFQFYPDDFLAGTIMMSNEERGAYITLLCLQWNQGHITIVDLADATADMEDHRTKRVSSKFRDLGDGTLQNQRLEEVRAKQEQYRSRQAESGRLGGRVSQERRSSTAQAPLEQDSSSPSPSPKETCVISAREAVEPPHGWPKTEAEVDQMRGHVALEVALKTWLLARGRGWRDAKDVPIRSTFPHWLEVANAFDRERKEKEKHGSNRTNSKPGTDRNAGTHNEGKASQYRNVGKVGPVGGV